MMLPTHTYSSVALATIVVFGSVPTIAQSPPAPSAPLTPGAIALRANSRDSSGLEQARTALSHADPTVRAVAARVLGIGRVRGAALNLRSALEGEGDEAAASELVRALLYLGDPESVGAVEARLPGAPWGAVQSYLEWLITVCPDNSAERLERLFKARPPRDFRYSSELIAQTVIRIPKERDRALRGLLGTAASAAWRAALDDLGADVAPAEAAVIQQALESSNDAIRRTTVWAVVARLAKRETIAAGVLDAALPAEIPVVIHPTVSVAWEQFGRELVARRHRQVRTRDRSTVIRTQARSYQTDARLLLQLQETLPAEREAATDVLGERNVAKAQPPPALESTPPRGQVVMRTAPIPWPALVPDLLRVTGCPVNDTVRLGLVEISYRPDGRPQAVGIAPMELPPECRPALAAIARLTIADPLLRIVDGEKQSVVVLISSDHLRCGAAERPTLRIDGEHVAPGRIKQPTKWRDVRPRYPKAAQEAGVQGTVIVEASISPTGCVTNLKVVRSVHAVLDLEAVRAVSQWRFTPTLVDDVAVSVIMTVTVRFNLG